jgi:hypothetical protein
VSTTMTPCNLPLEDREARVTKSGMAPKTDESVPVPVRWSPPPEKLCPAAGHVAGLFQASSFARAEMGVHGGHGDGGDILYCLVRTLQETPAAYADLYQSINNGRKGVEASLTTQRRSRIEVSRLAPS